MKLPVFYADIGYYLGGIITPNGFQYYYGKTLPKNFVALTSLATAKRDAELLEFARKALDDSVYRPSDVLSFSPFMVVRFDSIENAKKLATNAVGYPCETLTLLGAQYIKHIGLGTLLYKLGGDYFYCSPLGVSISYDPNLSYTMYSSACLFALYPSKFTIRDGKVYYGNELVVPSLSYSGITQGNPKPLLSWENMFEILCEISKIKKSTT